MENKQLSMFDILIETHTELVRQGPGSPDITALALSFLGNLNTIARAADLGCGTGNQTIFLAQNLPGTVVGVDLIPSFIDMLNENANKLNLGERVTGIVGDITKLPFKKEEFDLIWSEGVIDSVEFEKGINHWSRFLKKGGYIAITCPSWLTAEHPTEVEKFWIDAGSGLDTVESNISVMQKIGFEFVAAFALPEECWTDNYYTPREAAEKVFMEKHTGNETAEEYIKRSKCEMELYSKYKQHYGYVFYIGKKIKMKEKTVIFEKITREECANND